MMDPQPKINADSVGVEDLVADLEKAKAALREIERIGTKWDMGEIIDVFAEGHAARAAIAELEGKAAT